MIRPTFALACLVSAAALLSSPARAEDDAALLARAADALERGESDEAVDLLELLADRGLRDPAASYDRGMAYARRAAGESARPGDLGRAVAALAEAVALAPEDRDAALALSRVEATIARRRARAGAREIDPSPSPLEALRAAVPESTLAALTLGGAAALALGLALALHARGERTRVTGRTLAAVSALVALLAGGGVLANRSEREQSAHAVVVVEELRLRDDEGRALSGRSAVVPEGARVRVVEERGASARIEWGSASGWASRGELRVLPRR